MSVLVVWTVLVVLGCRMSVMIIPESVSIRKERVDPLLHTERVDLSVIEAAPQRGRCSNRGHLVLRDRVHTEKLHYYTSTPNSLNLKTCFHSVMQSEHCSDLFLEMLLLIHQSRQRFSNLLMSNCCVLVWFEASVFCSSLTEIAEGLVFNCHKFLCFGKVLCRDFWHWSGLFTDKSVRLTGYFRFF